MMAGMSRILLLGALALLAGCGREAPDWGPDQQGRTISAAELQGRWLIVNYWAEWCVPCRKEVPELNRLQAELPAGQVRVLGVNFDALEGAELQAAIAALGIGFTTLVQDPGPRLGIEPLRALPVTLLVDPAGQVRETLVGEQTADGLRARLRALGAAPGS